MFYKLRPADKIEIPGYKNTGKDSPSKKSTAQLGASPQVRLKPKAISPEEEKKEVLEDELDGASSFESCSFSSAEDHAPGITKVTLKDIMKSDQLEDRLKQYDQIPEEPSLSKFESHVTFRDAHPEPNVKFDKKLVLSNLMTGIKRIAE